VADMINSFVRGAIATNIERGGTLESLSTRKKKTKVRKCIRARACDASTVHRLQQNDRVCVWRICKMSVKMQTMANESMRLCVKYP